MTTTKIPMSYSGFDLALVQQNFALTFNETIDLFADTDICAPSPLLATTLKFNIPLANAINTEKARSELIVAPVLLEVKREITTCGLFSGIDFNVDPNLGLTGYVDFLLSKSSEQYFVQAPVLTIVEAKNENIVKGLGQCLASMYAARLFNNRSNNSIAIIYGVVTTGTAWQFLKLEEEIAYIDIANYYIDRVDKILGILMSVFK